MVDIENKIQRYDIYKDSGVEWLGDIPEHWEALANKYIFNLKKNQVGKNSDKYDLLSLTLKGIVIRNLENGGKFPAEFDTYQEVKKGDFVFCLFDVEETPRCVGLSNFEGMITGAYTVMEPNDNFDRSFLYYFYLNLDADKRMKPLYTGLRNTISKDNFFSFKTYVPPLKEQTAIAQFLDDKTTKIDEAITIKQQQINLLKERKQILIHKAVTQGLNPNVKLKDSGIEWIGEIPEHWKIKRFRYVFNLGKGLTITKDNLRDKGVFCVNYGEIHSKFGFELDTNIHKLKCVDKEYLISNSNALIKNGDFVFADTSEDLEGSGNFTYLKSENEIFAGYHTVVAKPKFEIESRFFAYIFESESFRNQIRTNVKGVKVYSITQSILKEPTVWFPSKKEQKEIVDYLDDGTKKIETAINLKQQEIEKLKEYKSSLINSAVTGKVKV
ncbi:MAG: restriction endonuclease subunit S [Lutibacter sp.]